MAKYVANPVEVEAFEIESMRVVDSDGGHEITLKDSFEKRYLEAGAFSRFKPAPGDYYVVQSDGYVYLNPKSVFERKYRPA